MRRLTPFLLAALWLPPMAAAEPEAVRPAGVQAEPPQGPAVVREPLPEEPGGRRAIRGCPVGRTCARLEDELRGFELEAFGAGNPWIERDLAPGSGGGVVRNRPSELRPDLPWLDELTLPDLPVHWDQHLIDYLLYYKDDPRGRATMRGWLRAQGRYRDLILAELRKTRLPEDLLYVAMIESSYDPKTTSYAGACGLWQLMPAGGRIYGLEINRWIDERKDPMRSTLAAVGYWADLYQRFGNWDLALAAYNSGYGAVLRAISRYNTNDFWQLTRYENALPWDTALYVPKVLATAIVGRNRERFGLGDVADEPAETWDDVRVPTSVPVAVIARAAGTTVDDLRRLNPHILRGRTPPQRPDYVVRVPAGAGRSFGARFEALRPDWDGFDAYVVAYGERFEDVATQFGTSVRRLRELNDVEHESEIAGGTLIVVPRISAEARRKNLEKARDDLHASGVDQRPGEPLIVAVPDKDATIDGRRRVFYRVITGDTIESIARVLAVTAHDLAVWNGLSADAKLHPRMVIQAWVAPTFDEDRARVRLLDDSRILVVTRGSAEHLALAEARVGRERVEYTPAQRESFEQIGRKFGLGARDLGRINRRSHTTVVEPGETIVVYKVVDRTRSDRAAEQWRKTPREKKPQRSRRGGTPEANAKHEGAKADAKAKVDPTSSRAKANDRKGSTRGSSSDGPVSRPDQID